MNLQRLREIAEHQRETGCRVEYDAGTILDLIDRLERAEHRLAFCLRNFVNPNIWTAEEIDRAEEAQKAKRFALHG